MSKDSGNSEELEIKGREIDSFRDYVTVTCAVNVALAVTQVPTTLLSYAGAQMTRQNVTFTNVISQISKDGIPEFWSRMRTSLKRRVGTFGLPYPAIMYASQEAGITNPLIPSVIATALETFIASSPKFGSEVSERFGLVNGPMFNGIKGTLFRITKDDFNTQFNALSETTKGQCGSYESLESLREVARRNKPFNRMTLALRNFSFFTAVAAKDIIQQQVNVGNIPKDQQEIYEQGARLSASIMSVFPDVLFTYIASGRKTAAEAIKFLPEAFIKNAKTLPIIPRILTCYVAASAANYGFDVGKEESSSSKLSSSSSRRVSKINVDMQESQKAFTSELANVDHKTKADVEKIHEIVAQELGRQIPQMVEVIANIAQDLKIQDPMNLPLDWEDKYEGAFIKKVMEITWKAQVEVFNESERSSSAIKSSSNSANNHDPVDGDLRYSPSPSPIMPEVKSATTSVSTKKSR